MNNIEKTKERKKYNKIGLLFILPSFIGVAIFILIPFMDVVIRSFQNEVLRDFIGLDNYKEVFTNTAFKLAATNTMKFAFVGIPLLLIVSLIIAVVLKRSVSKVTSMYLKTAFLIPIAIPTASVVLIWKIFFHENGILSGILVGLGYTGVDWMNTNYAFWILIGSYIWKNLGYTIILWFAGLNYIEKEVYEAAMVDGAGEWKLFTKIIIPSLKPTLYTITVLSLINSFKVFREAYLIGGNYPHESMYLLQHLFNNWFLDLSFGKMSATSVIMAVVIFILITMLQKGWEKD